MFLSFLIFRVNARVEVTLTVIKAVLVLTYCFFQDVSFVWVKILVLVIASTITFNLYLNEKPYFNRSFNKVMSIFHGIFAWTNYLILLGTLLGDASAQFNMLMILFFLGIPIICALILTPSADSQLRVLLTPIFKF